MKKILSLFIYFTFISCSCLAFAQSKKDEHSFNPVYASVLEDNINIRAGAGLNFEIIGQLNKSLQVAVIDEEYNWYKIRLPEKAICFVHKDYINSGIVTANNLRVRAGAGLNYNVLGFLKKGERVNIVSAQENWLQITAPESCCGWVNKDLLLLSNRPVIENLGIQMGNRKVSVPQAAPAMAENKTEVQGVIDELGMIVNRKGTHKLIEGKKILYYLNSKNIDLNNYVRRRVRIIGHLQDYEDSPYPVIEVKKLTLQ